MRQVNTVDSMKMQQEFVQNVLSCSLLTEEDYEYILLNQESLQTEKETHRPDQLPKSTPIILPFVIALVGIVLVFATTISFGIEALCLLVIVSLLGKYLFEKIMKIKSVNHATEIIESLNSYLQLNVQFQSTTKKSLRFIQEMEIAKMGYTLVSGKPPINRLLRTRQRMVQECIQLRLQVLKSCVDVSLNHREAALKIIGLLQDSRAELKFSLSLCQIPIEELGPCFDREKSVEDLAEATDNFCLDVLRDTHHFMIAGRSEFLKLMSLAIGPWKGGGSEFYKALRVLRSLCEHENEKLAEVYNLHRNVQTRCADVRHSSSIPANSLRTPLHTAVHSAQVHLRVALQVAIQSEDVLTDCSEKDFLKDHLLPQLKIHLDASTQCVSEAFKSFDVEPETPKLRIPDPGCAGKGVTNADIKADDSLLDPKEDFTEDQVFEAVAEEPVDTETDNPRKDDADFNAEARKERIAETKHVMSELRTVLHIKTSAQEREIRKSKLFPDYAPKVVQPCQVAMVTCTETEDGQDRVADQHAENGWGRRNCCARKSSFSGEGDMPALHEVLRLPRRPPAPSRRGGRKHWRVRKYSEELDDSSESDPGDDNPTIAKGDAVRLGFGFPSLLASQAAKMAVRAKTMRDGGGGLVGEEATFGDSESES